jgi:hypothetical protein
MKLCCNENSIVFISVADSDDFCPDPDGTIQMAGPGSATLVAIPIVSDFRYYADRPFSCYRCFLQELFCCVDIV